MCKLAARFVYGPDSAVYNQSIFFTQLPGEIVIKICRVGLNVRVIFKKKNSGQGGDGEGMVREHGGDDGDKTMWRR